MLQNPVACRTGAAPCTPLSMEEAIYCLVHHAPNGKSAQAVADELGWTYAKLLAVVDPLRGDRLFPAAKLEAAIVSAGGLLPLRFLAGRVGCGVFTLPTSTGAGRAIQQRLLRVLKELGELSGSLERYLADERLDSDEALQAIRELRQVSEELVGLEAEIQHEAKLSVVVKPAAARMALPASAALAKAGDR
jgi:hypothetical protein